MILGNNKRKKGIVNMNKDILKNNLFKDFIDGYNFHVDKCNLARDEMNKIICGLIYIYIWNVKLILV